MKNVIRIDCLGKPYFYVDTSPAEALIACYADVIRNDWDIDNWHKYHVLITSGMNTPHLRDDDTTLMAHSVGIYDPPGDVPEIRLSEMLFRISTNMRKELIARAFKPGVTGVVLFGSKSEEQSSEAILVLGPKPMTYQSVENVRGSCIKDSSDRSIHPLVWVPVPKLEKSKPKRLTAIV